MTAASTTTRTVEASQAKPGQWLIYANRRMNQRIVDIDTTRDGQIRMYADYGNGGEPATLFFDATDKIWVSDTNEE
jgi:hypothetical protein